MKCIACDATMTESSSWLFECNKCGFFASTLEPNAGRGIEGLEALRRENFEKICTHLNKLEPLKNKTLLEVGCAEGWFLEAAAKRGMKICALEPSEEHAKIASSKGFEVENDFFPGKFEQADQFDYIVFNDVFEHLPEPTQSLKECENLLKSGGYLVLNIPSSTGIFYKLGTLLAKFGMTSLHERLWQKGLPSPHLSYFNQKNLVQFVSQHSSLKLCQDFSVDTVSQTGLHERISASHKGVIGRLVFSILYCLVPVINKLPKDIIVCVFKKKSS